MPPINPAFKEFNRRGNVLISDQFNNRVIEVNPRGDIIWSYGLGPTDFTSSSIIGVRDAERIGDKTLMAGGGVAAGVIPEAPNGVADNRVILVSRRGRIIWQYGQFGVAGTGFNMLNTPVHCVFIPGEKRERSGSRGRSRSGERASVDSKMTHRSGSRGRSRSRSESRSPSRSRSPEHHGNCVLITDKGNNRVILVNNHRKIVWEYPIASTLQADRLNSPNSVEKLKNGHYLIADEGNSRAIEVNRHHVIVRTFTAGGTLGACSFASRLPNGNTLLTDAGNNRIIEVNNNNIIVWQYITNSDPKSILISSPSRAVRLENGETLISDQFNNRVIRITRTNILIASYGLPINGGTMIGINKGYNLMTTQMGLYCPHDAKIIKDYTGLTDPL
jgi:hypothetical protein